MRSHVVLAAALARIALASPAPAPQQFDFAAVLNAPDVDQTGPAISAVTDSVVISTASLAASISSDVVTGVATASVTGSSAIAASSQVPTQAKRGVATTTTSSSTACPTTPEAGTYCGFINPEDPCAPQPDGYGPKVNNPDTPAAFEAYPYFHGLAKTASLPYGSSYVNTFRDLNASTSANSYLGLQTLQSYNVSQCAAYCDSTNLCTSFNLYIERDPSLNPVTNYTWSVTNQTYNCPNPPSITNYKCTIWGSSIDAASATNFGDYRDQFQVVIAGSSGWTKTNTTTPPSCPGFKPPTSCPNGAISAGGLFWMGSQFFPGPFDPTVCGLYAQAQTAKNKASAIAKGGKTYVPCNSFNAYMVKLNGVPQGTYCSLFDTVLGPAWAKFSGGWSGGDYFGVETSYSYALQNTDFGLL